jgi:uracil-DNA glycosylase
MAGRTTLTSGRRTERTERTDPVYDAVHQVMAMVVALDVPGALNLYDEAASVACGDAPGAATGRRQALHGYLADHWSAPVVLVGEAPGRHGARLTGVPFTSPHQLTGSGPKETSATVVHRVLTELGRSADVLLWNASVLFPPDNRDPRPPEVEASAPVLERICRGRTVVAVGRYAERATGAPYLRHPSHGGATRFAEGLRLVLG